MMNTQKIKLLITEEEKDTKLELTSFIKKEFPGVEIVHSLNNNYMKRFSVKKGNQLVIYKENELQYFQAEGKYVCMVDYCGGTSIIGHTMDELEKDLDPSIFFRINRKYIVSVEAIKRMVLYDRYRIKIETHIATKDDMIVSVDRSLKFKKWINKV